MARIMKRKSAIYTLLAAQCCALIHPTSAMTSRRVYKRKALRGKKRSLMGVKNLPVALQQSSLATEPPCSGAGLLQLCCRMLSHMPSCINEEV